MRDFLRMNDLDVELCTDGEMGREAFHRERFDLCILDVMMPESDGFPSATEIKKSTATSPSSFSRPKRCATTLKGYQIGADDYVTKPFRLGNPAHEGECHP